MGMQMGYQVNSVSFIDLLVILMDYFGLLRRFQCPKPGISFLENGNNISPTG